MMKLLAALVVISMLALAGCAGTSGTDAPVITCPKLPAGTPAFRVVEDTTIWDRRAAPEDGSRAIAVVRAGQHVEWLLLEEDDSTGPWFMVACGTVIGWALADNGKSGTERRTWLELL